jgi:hypothetical protein
VQPRDHVAIVPRGAEPRAILFAGMPDTTTRPCGIAPVVASACLFAACMELVGVARIGTDDATAAALRAVGALAIGVTLSAGWLVDVRKWSGSLAAIPWSAAAVAGWLCAIAIQTLSTPSPRLLHRLDGIELLAAAFPIAGAAMRRRELAAPLSATVVLAIIVWLADGAAIASPPAPTSLAAAVAFAGVLPAAAWFVGGVVLLQRVRRASPLPAARVRRP